MTTESNQLTEIIESRDVAVMPGFASNASWELAQRIGKAFAASSLVPAQYQNNVANCIVALEMANRMGASPLMVMQNLYIVHGNPGWSSKFLIACFNQCGRFSSMRYEWTPDKSGCRAWAIEKETGERIDGPQVTMAMAQAEGWSTKSGSKWKTMPELMLMYRSAAFLIRTYAPEISMGLRTDDELIDMAPAHVEPQKAKAAEISALLAGEPKQLVTDAPNQKPAASPGKPEVWTYAQFADAINKATDDSVAGLLLDEAQDVLDAAMHADLKKVYDRKFPPVR